MTMSKNRAGLTHLDAEGRMHMVDVGGKAVTRRIAVAEARVKLGPAARKELASPQAKKGDVLAAVRLAGITAAKRTWELIPLCHPLPLSRVSVEVETTRAGVTIRAQAETAGQTGVEMEAMTAASVAALTLYDMLKGVERGIVIERVCLLRKEGGSSGTWTRAARKRRGA